jgi:hypothetical protein
MPYDLAPISDHEIAEENFLDAVGSGQASVGEVAEWFGCSRSRATALTRNIQDRRNQQ